MEETSLLVMVVGLPGTGKSTFARILAQQIDAHHLNSDMIRHDLGLQGHYDPDAKAKVYQQLRNETERLLKNENKVIVDATLYLRQLREPYLKLGERLQKKVYWIEMQADEQTIKSRVEKKRRYSEADFAVYQKIKKAYEPLNEKHLVLVTDEMDAAEMLSKALHFLQL